LEKIYFKRVRKNNNLPSSEMIDSGCYIDFEGFGRNEYQKSPSPILIGIFKDGNFKQIVFTKEYRWAALDPNVKHLVEYIPNRSQYLSKLVNSIRVKAPLFAYSDYEKNVITNQIGYSIDKRYRNVLSIYKRFRNKKRGSCPLTSPNEKDTLIRTTKTLGISLPKKLGKNGVADRLREVRNYSRSRVSWASAPKEVRKKWAEILEHNRSDCICLYDILKKLRQKNDSFVN
jgi:hypothetical protein